MQLKEISKDIYDVDAWLDDSLGKPGTPECERNTEKAWEEYNAQILLDARKMQVLPNPNLPSASALRALMRSRTKQFASSQNIWQWYRLSAFMTHTLIFIS